MTDRRIVGLKAVMTIPRSDFHYSLVVPEIPLTSPVTTLISYCVTSSTFSYLSLSKPSPFKVARPRFLV